MTRIALDTNILGYAEGLGDARRQTRAIGTLQALRSHDLGVPLQAIGELHSILARKGGRTAAAASLAALDYLRAMEPLPTTTDGMIDALDLAARHRLSTWDALIVATAAIHGCELLLSEDMQEGFRWKSVTVANPLADVLHPKLAALMPQWD